MPSLITINSINKIENNSKSNNIFSTSIPFVTFSTLSKKNFNIKNSNSNEDTKLTNASSPANSITEIANVNTESNSNSNLISFSSSTISNNLYNQTNTHHIKILERKKLGRKIKEIKIKHKRLSKEGHYNCGRWQPEEHKRFIEAIMKYGNEWKLVQKHVGTRSSTQARSHAQKFFVKIKKTNTFHFKIDLSKNSIKTLHEMANNLSSDDYFNAIKALNCVAFERKMNSVTKKRSKKEDINFNDSNNFCFSDVENGNINLM